MSRFNGCSCVVWLLLLLAPLFSTLHAFGFGAGTEGCGGDCSACHTVKKSEATAIVKGLDPDATVESISPSPVRGLYQVVVRKGGETAVLYLDFSKKYLIAGRIIDTVYKRDLTEEQLARMRRIDPAEIPVEDALVLGNQNGTRKLYVFTDPDCPFCARLHAELASMVKSDPELKVYLLLMPLAMHPDAVWKSDAIVCTSKKGMEKGLKLLEESFAGKPLARGGAGLPTATTGERSAKSWESA